MNAIRAEIRKLLTLRYWWALGIAPIAIGLLVGFIVLALINDSADAFGEIPGLGRFIVVFITTLAVSLFVVSLFAALFGTVTGATETTTGTISRTFLTSASRHAVIASKVAVTVVVALIYLIAIFITSLISLLIALASDSDAEFTVDGLGDLLLIFMTFAIVVVLWSVLGLGLGMLVGRTAGAAVALVVWYAIGEFITVGILNAIAGLDASIWLPLRSSYDFVLWAVFTIFDEHDPSGLGGLSILFLILWAAVFLAAGWIRLTTREAR